MPLDDRSGRGETAYELAELRARIEAPPADWITDFDAVERRLLEAKRGRVAVFGRSFGGHPLWRISYGEPRPPRHRANYSSALGSLDPGNYLRRAGRPPHILIFAAIHGLELEGTAALMDLVELLETGLCRGFLEEDGLYLREHVNAMTLTLVPIANPDGRIRYSGIDALGGLRFEDVRQIMQGIWADGTTAGWPEVKAEHPIAAGRMRQLGAYFNDAGVNPMHDSFPLLQSLENRALFELIDSERPDYILSLHGGTNTPNCLLRHAYVAPYVERHNAALSRVVAARSAAIGLAVEEHYAEAPLDGRASDDEMAFNLMSAQHQFCGAVVLLYECNQGLDIPDKPRYRYDQMRQAHGILFAEICRHALAHRDQELHDFTL